MLGQTGYLPLLLLRGPNWHNLAQQVLKKKVLTREFLLYMKDIVYCIWSSKIRSVNVQWSVRLKSFQQILYKNNPLYTPQ